ncbi:hypothetical protein PAF17_16055 [Paracoccus sp. Z330]|uniref:Uncharacterized protein n=1 Tax=Paracoccus onchidii TaxID=3017813 RepID=A0ABT4ZI17_9RHOB|nr:hypothetical protein [Paracoccus onchidii]MDB6179006.1 hypothetical protein [Paracoccus onchidii]
MIQVTIYDDTGEILQTMEVADEAEAAMNVPSGGGYILGSYNDAEYYVQNGVIAAIPEKPADHLIFNKVTGQWEDPRSQAMYDGALHQARLAAEIPTNLAFLRFAEAGAFPMSELADDTTSLPATVEEFLNLPGFTPAQHDAIKAGLKSWPTVSRGLTRLVGPLHPDDPGDGLPYFVPWLSSEKGITITDETLDGIFEVDMPPPIYTPE